MKRRGKKKKMDVIQSASFLDIFVNFLIAIQNIVFRNELPEKDLLMLLY